MSNGYYTNGNGHHKKEKVVLAQDGLLYDEEAEKAVLGSLVFEPDCYGYIRPIVNKEDFYLIRHQWLYEDITTIIESGEQPDVMTVVDKMNRREKSPDYGWDAYIIDVIQSVATSYNAQSYARIVQDYAIRRRMMLAGLAMANHAHNMARPVDESLPEIEQSVMNLRGTRADQGVVTAREAARSFLDTLETKIVNRQELPGLPTGYIDLDRLLGGLEVQHYLLAGRPAMGKSSLALDIALHDALKLKKRVLFFSLEMSTQQIMTRAVSHLASIPLNALKKPHLLSEGDMKAVHYYTGLVSESGLIIDPTDGLTPSQIRAKALRQLTIHGNIDLVIIDHIHRMSADNERLTGNEMITAISKQLSQLHKLIGCPVLTLSQLSRAVEQRTDKRPILSDLRDSGSLEQDAYGVMFIYRDEYYYEGMSEKKGIAEIIVAKNRDGATGTADLLWRGETTSLFNLQRTQVSL